MFLFIIFSNCLEDDDYVVTQELVDSINNDSKSTFKAKLYPQFAQMTKKDFQKFLSPVRKPPQIHSSARPVGFSERSFYNSDKRMFTGIGKEVVCRENLDPGNSEDRTHEFSNSANLNRGTSNQAPADQFECISDKNYIRYYVQYNTFLTVDGKKYAEVPVRVYDNTKFCSSWATAVTSAMSLTLSRWSDSNVNLSVQFLLDCDILGDPCIERPPLSAYEQFWRRYIPPISNWRGSDGDLNPLKAPSRLLTQEICDNYRGCYPGQDPSVQSCKRNLVLTGICEPGSSEYGACPIYFLYNWRWIKSHLAEVGAVTSSILARAALFTYEDGVYSSWPESQAGDTGNTPPDPSSTDERSEILGMLDVTIIGWGQEKVNLTDNDDLNTKLRQRWWYVIPHLGTDFGLECKTLMEILSRSENDVDDLYNPNQFSPDSYGFGGITYKSVGPTGTIGTAIAGFYFVFGNGTVCGTDGPYSYIENPYNSDPDPYRTGIIKFNRRFDDSTIESQAVGAVPFNFIPKPWRTPASTWSKYEAPTP